MPRSEIAGLYGNSVFGFIKKLNYFGLAGSLFAACRLSPVVVSRGSFPVAVCGLPIAMASLVAEHRL